MPQHTDFFPRPISELDLRLLRIFKVVVECGGFTPAEEVLNVTKSTISVHISKLEARLNVRLANRKKQEAAFPILKKLVEKHNAEEKASRPEKPKKTPREIVERLQSKIRQNRWLAENGIEIKHEWPSKYSIEEAKVIVQGRTFDYKDTLKRFGFRWNGSHKHWEMSLDKWGQISDKFLPTFSKAIALNNRRSSAEDLEMAQRIATEALRVHQAAVADEEMAKRIADTRVARYRWMERDYVMHPEHMLNRAVYWGELTREEVDDAIAGRNDDLAQIADEHAMYISVPEGHGFGTSDGNAYIKEMLRDIKRMKKRKGIASLVVAEGPDRKLLQLAKAVDRVAQKGHFALEKAFATYEKHNGTYKGKPEVAARAKAKYFSTAEAVLKVVLPLVQHAERLVSSGSLPEQSCVFGTLRQWQEVASKLPESQRDDLTLRHFHKKLLNRLEGVAFHPDGSMHRYLQDPWVSPRPCH